MKKTMTIVVFVCLFLLATLAIPSAQLKKQDILAKPLKPIITSVTQDFYTLSINLVLNGTNFPPKSSGNLNYMIRLLSKGGAGDAKGESSFVGGTGNWTPTRIDDLLPFNIEAGRKYLIGLIRYESSSPNVRTLISNQVEFLLLMHVDNVTPNPVALGTTEVEVKTANLLAPQGAKIVKVGNLQAQVLKWGGPNPQGGIFRIRIPNGLAVPGVHDLFVEENGIVVSNKAKVRLLGPQIK